FATLYPTVTRTPHRLLPPVVELAAERHVERRGRHVRAQRLDHRVAPDQQLAPVLWRRRLAPRGDLRPRLAALGSRLAALGPRLAGFGRAALRGGRPALLLLLPRGAFGYRPVAGVPLVPRPLI